MIAIHVITFLLNLEVAKKISRMEGIIQMQIYGHEQIPQCLLDSATIDCGIFLCPLNLATKKRRRLCMICTASKNHDWNLPGSSPHRSEDDPCSVSAKLSMHTPPACFLGSSLCQSTAAKAFAKARHGPLRAEKINQRLVHVDIAPEVIRSAVPDPSEVAAFGQAAPAVGEMQAEVGAGGRNVAVRLDRVRVEPSEANRNIGRGLVHLDDHVRAEEERGVRELLC